LSSKKPVIFLHIGAPKTGTTFLQKLMSANKANLLEAGYMFPGNRWREQGLATREVLGRKGSTEDPGMRADIAGKWEKLTKEMLAFDGTASIFSMEFLSFAKSADAVRIMSSLDEATVHVVLGVRDALGAIPAQWQTRSRSGGTLSWPEFARGVARIGDPAARTHDAVRTWQRAQGVPRILQVWGQLVPPERLHVLTVPPSGSDELLLWQRFAEVVGVDPTVASTPIGRANTSMGQASADLMRRINAELGPVPISQYEETLSHRLAKKILAPRSPLEARAKVDAATMEFAARWNRRVRAAITESGAHVVGDLEDLPVEIPAEVLAAAPRELVEPSAEEILAAAAAARDGMIDVIKARSREVGRFRRGGRHVDTDTPTDPKRWSRSPEPVQAAVTEVTELVRTAMELQNHLKGKKLARA
jgi:hypothetical protein